MKYIKIPGIVLASAVAGYIVYRKLYNKQCEVSPLMEYKPGVVYLHIFPYDKGKGVVNLSPYAIKLESWVRLKGIPHEIVETCRWSTKTKQTPYMIYNGEEYPDSDLIIEFLRKTFNVDPTDGLDVEQQGIARAISRMLDEGTSWTYFLYRYVYHGDEFSKYFSMGVKPESENNKLRQAIYDRFKIRAQYQGIGRKTEAEAMDIGCEDIRAVSKYLGDKKFIMGDNITTVDCAVFAHLSQIAYCGCNFPHTQVMQTECTNIIPYLNRFKDTLWKDYNKLCDVDGIF